MTSENTLIPVLIVLLSLSVSITQYRTDTAHTESTSMYTDLTFPQTGYRLSQKCTAQQYRNCQSLVKNFFCFDRPSVQLSKRAEKSVTRFYNGIDQSL